MTSATVLRVSVVRPKLLAQQLDDGQHHSQQVSKKPEEAKDAVRDPRSSLHLYSSTPNGFTTEAYASTIPSSCYRVVTTR